MANKIFKELDELTKEELRTREEKRSRYTSLLEKAKGERNALIVQRDAAEASGNVETYSALKRKLLKLEDDIDTYSVGTVASGDVNLTEEEIQSKLSAADAEIRAYLISESDKLETELTEMFSKFEGLINSVETMKTTANSFSATMRSDSKTVYQKSVAFDGYVYRSKEGIKYIIEDIKRGIEALRK